MSAAESCEITFVLDGTSKTFPLTRRTDWENITAAIKAAYSYSGDIEYIILLDADGDEYSSILDSNITFWKIANSYAGVPGYSFRAVGKAVRGESALAPEVSGAKRDDKQPGFSFNVTSEDKRGVARVTNKLGTWRDLKESLGAAVSLSGDVISHFVFIDNENDPQSLSIDSTAKFWKYVDSMGSLDTQALKVFRIGAATRKAPVAVPEEAVVVPPPLPSPSPPSPAVSSLPAPPPEPAADPDIQSALLFAVKTSLLNPDLWNACVNGSLEDVRALVENGADPQSCNVNGSQPIHFAALGGNISVIKYLVSLGCDPCVVNKSGFSPLHFAVDSGTLESVLELRGMGADLFKETVDGYSPLVYICGRGATGVFTALHEQKEINLNWKNSHGQGCLHILAAEEAMNVALIEELVDIGANIDILDNEKRSPLLVACLHKNTKAAQTLIRCGAATNILGKNRHVSPLSAACSTENFPLVVALVENKAELSFTDRDGNTCVHIAAETGNVRIVRYLIESGAPIDSTNRGGLTPADIASSMDHQEVMDLMTAFEGPIGRDSIFLNACAEGDMEFLESFVEAGSDPREVVSENGSNGVHIACVFGQIDVVKGLKACGVPLNAMNNAGMTPFLWSCEVGQLSSVVYLLSRGVDIDQRSRLTRNTGLHFASKNSHDSVVEWLIRHDADMSLDNYDGDTAFDLACLGGHVSTCSLLSKNNFFVEDLMRVSKMAAKEGSQAIEASKVMVESTRSTLNNFSVAQVLDTTSLPGDAKAVLDEIQDTVKESLSCIPNVSKRIAKALDDDDLKDSVWGICLPSINQFRAAITTFEVKDEEDEEDEEEQEQRGTETQQTQEDDDDSENASLRRRAGQSSSDKPASATAAAKEEPVADSLHYAASVGDLELTRSLLKELRAADVNSLDEAGLSPLYIACANGHGDIAMALIERRATLTKICKPGNSPLHLICANGFGAILNAIVAIPKSVLPFVNYNVASTSDGRTPLHEAAAAGHVEVCTVLVAAGSTLDLRDNEGKSPIILACEYGRIAITGILADNGADISIKDNEGFTAFLRAVASGNLKLCKLIWSHGANIDECTRAGENAVHLACRAGALDVLQWVVLIGVDYTVRNTDGKLPIELASELGDNVILSWFRKTNRA